MNQLSNNTSNRLLARNLQNSQNLDLAQQEVVANSQYLKDEEENLQRERARIQNQSRQSAPYISFHKQSMSDGLTNTPPLIS
mmetsp:Transcript_20109/g.30879  ORF Transcript_20109/g.30879 Transcript_20109/m.30879 type:complete len:82 (-) Transcript_20109:1761-2006(-)